MSLTKQPLRELMNEAAELHRNLNSENPRQIRYAITSVKFALQNRYQYLEQNKHRLGV